MDFAFSFEMWQARCIRESENAIENTISIPFENSLEYSTLQ